MDSSDDLDLLRSAQNEAPDEIDAAMEDPGLPSAVKKNARKIASLLNAKPRKLNEDERHAVKQAIETIKKCASGEATVAEEAAAAAYGYKHDASDDASGGDAGTPGEGDPVDAGPDGEGVDPADEEERTAADQ